MAFPDTADATRRRRAPPALADRPSNAPRRSGDGAATRRTDRRLPLTSAAPGHCQRTGRVRPAPAHRAPAAVATRRLRGRSRSARRSRLRLVYGSSLVAITPILYPRLRRERAASRDGCGLAGRGSGRGGRLQSSRSARAIPSTANNPRFAAPSVEAIVVAIESDAGGQTARWPQRLTLGIGVHGRSRTLWRTLQNLYALRPAANPTVAHGHGRTWRITDVRASLFTLTFERQQPIPAGPR